MSSDELDAFRSELLRQKIVFEAELRRQREYFEERISVLAQELADREADCRNLQSVVTILGKKVELLAERRPTTPRRPAALSRTNSMNPPDLTLRRFPTAEKLSREGQQQPRLERFSRRASPLVMSTTAPSTLPLRRISSIGAMSRTSSPGVSSGTRQNRATPRKGPGERTPKRTSSSNGRRLVRRSSSKGPLNSAKPSEN